MDAGSNSTFVLEGSVLSIGSALIAFVPFYTIIACIVLLPYWRCTGMHPYLSRRESLVPVRRFRSLTLHPILPMYSIGIKTGTPPTQLLLPTQRSGRGGGYLFPLQSLDANDSDYTPITPGDWKNQPHTVAQGLDYTAAEVFDLEQQSRQPIAAINVSVEPDTNAQASFDYLFDAVNRPILASNMSILPCLPDCGTVDPPTTGQEAFTLLFKRTVNGSNTYITNNYGGGVVAASNVTFIANTSNWPVQPYPVNLQVAVSQLGFIAIRNGSSLFFVLVSSWIVHGFYGFLGNAFFPNIPTG